MLAGFGGERQQKTLGTVLSQRFLLCVVSNRILIPWAPVQPEGRFHPALSAETSVLLLSGLEPLASLGTGAWSW